MPFADKHPDKIEFEIDRENVCRFYQRVSFVITSILSILGGMFLCVFGLLPYLANRPEPSLTHITLVLVIYACASVIVGLGIGWTIYWGWFHEMARLHSEHLRLMVDGPFLRIVSGAYSITDHRVHFRDVGDYYTHDNWEMRRFGVRALTFRIKGPPNVLMTTTIHGLTKPDLVCNQLCEIDAAREA